MSIDDGTYPLGSNSEALRVSSSDWNDQWERQVIIQLSYLIHKVMLCYVVILFFQCLLNGEKNW